MKNLLLITLALMLITAASIQIRLGMHRSIQPGPELIPGEKIPRTLPGWSVQDMPLGVTEANSNDAAAMLNFDAYVYRQYRRGEAAIIVYIGYWSAGKMPIQEVACHSPDVCWVANGWIAEHATSNVTMQAGGSGINGAEYRIFRDKDGNRQYVYFWHVTGNRIFMTYGNRYRSLGAITAWWKDITLQPLRSPPEQIFIRISSNHELATLEQDGGLREISNGLRGIVPQQHEH